MLSRGQALAEVELDELVELVDELFALSLDEEDVELDDEELDDEEELLAPSELDWVPRLSLR